MQQPTATVPFDVVPDPRVRAVLARLHSEAERQERFLRLRFLAEAPRFLLGRPLRWDRVGPRLDDAFISLDRSQGAFCYLLARALGARRIVEFGTSFGVSTIWLAAAVRENGGGAVIGTELVSSKAARARQHLREAGLEDFVEIREGDAVETLAGIEGPVDMMLNDGFPPKALDVLRVVEPAMRAGAVVVAENVGAFPADHADYVAWLRDPRNGWVSTRLALNEGTELSVRGIEHGGLPAWETPVDDRKGVRSPTQA
jgi:predicted O-methyltransferase YrrM